MNEKIIFIFLDGIGLGFPNNFNPFYLYPMNKLESLIGCSISHNAFNQKNGSVIKSIDACLDVKGIPQSQSATGQTALFTGINASKILGYHLMAYPDKILTDIIFKHNILKKTNEKGKKALFANAYDLDRYFSLIKKKKIRHSATTLSTISAGIPFRNLEDLKEGKAVYWDITNKTLAPIHRDIDIINGETAGKRIAQLTYEFDLILFESFMPDILGHKKSITNAGLFLGVLDQFIYGIISNIEKNVTVIISSDHGNMEDLSTGLHTLNPVPLIAIGNKSEAFSHASSILDIPKIILSLL
ncbi:MAG: phosphoglyceromutase [Desulfobacterales bacterium]|nr:phosphoglyceromutase [Desulfobacterales bacterium]